LWVRASVQHHATHITPQHQYTVGVLCVRCAPSPTRSAAIALQHLHLHAACVRVYRRVGTASGRLRVRAMVLLGAATREDCWTMSQRCRQSKLSMPPAIHSRRARRNEDWPTASPRPAHHGTCAANPATTHSRSISPPLSTLSSSSTPSSRALYCGQHLGPDERHSKRAATSFVASLGL
jgi:hypothetical protein